jgi:fatty acid desaturase
MTRLKRRATITSPRLERPAARRGRSTRSVARREFRRIDPGVFLGKIALLAVLLAIFAGGIQARDEKTTRMCSLLLGLPFLILGWDSLTRPGGWAEVATNLLRFTLVPLAVLGSLVLAVPYSPRVLCQVGLGIMLAHGTELAHQALHKTGTGSGRWDPFLGSVLCEATGISFELFRWTHHLHHVNNGTAEDRESFDYSYGLLTSDSRAVRLIGFVWHVSMLAHFATLARRMGLAVSGRLRDRLREEYPVLTDRRALLVEREYRRMAAVLLAILLLCAAFRTAAPIAAWLVPVLVVWGPSHALIELSEHWACDVPNADVFVNTRSIRAGRFAQWLTNHNNAHVGHHSDMLVPLDKIEAYQEELLGSHDLKFLEDSYPAFFAKFFRYLWTGQLAGSEVTRSR